MSLWPPVATLLLALLVACSAPHDPATRGGADTPAPPAITQAPQDSAVKSAQPVEADEISESEISETDEFALGTPKQTKVGEVDYSCRTDADCTIKDVGNCCGYYPACVNVDSPTFPEQVLAACAASDMAGVCGFPSLSGCRCVEGRCEGIKGLGPGLGSPQDTR